MHQRLTTAAMNIRPVRADDTLLMQTFLQGLGDESRRHRFHGAVNVCSSGLLRLMTCADGSRHVAWVVVGTAFGGPRLLGEARFFRSERGDDAEMALAVADDLLRDKLLEWLEANSTITETAAGESSDDAEGSKTKAKADQKAEKKAKKGAGKEG